MLKKIQNFFFRKIHGNNLVYNTCWEDPRCDRTLLEFDKDSEVVMITSAGCNALAYLLDHPKTIHCVDMNPRQNALLELKKAMFRRGDFETLFQAFGDGKLKNAKSHYLQNLRPTLPTYAQEYWDKRIYYFNGKGLRKTFYFHGTSGVLAFLLKSYMKGKKKLNQSVKQFFQASSLEQQSLLFQKIDEQFWSRIMAWFMNRHLVMSLAGVPKSQQQLFTTRYKNGAMDYMRECLNHTFTQVPVQDNYFWQLYYNGHYNRDCCPDYLMEKNYSSIKSNVDHIHTHTTTITNFLKENPGKYSHFILLDHQDWLAENDVEALKEEWQYILNNSKKGTKILLRSAAAEVNFFPDFVKEKVDFKEELARDIHLKDRVGTYASTYLGVVK